jgi:hypothetical protein
MQVSNFKKCNKLVYRLSSNVYPILLYGENFRVIYNLERHIVNAKASGRVLFFENSNEFRI